MRLTVEDRIDSDERVYTLTISHAEMIDGTMYAFDRALIRECEASDRISDKLLALETIVRRAEDAATSTRAADK